MTHPQFPWSIVIFSDNDRVCLSPIREVVCSVYWLNFFCNKLWSSSTLTGIQNFVRITDVDVLPISRKSLHMHTFRKRWPSKLTFSYECHLFPFTKNSLTLGWQMLYTCSRKGMRGHARVLQLLCSHLDEEEQTHLRSGKWREVHCIWVSDDMNGIR